MRHFKYIFALLALTTAAIAADNLIGDGRSGNWQLIDNSGNHWNARIGYTTDGAGDIFTLGNVASTDNVIGMNPSGNRTLVDNSGKWWSASVIYTTDGAGNVIPVPAGGGGGGYPNPTPSPAGYYVTSTGTGYVLTQPSPGPSGPPGPIGPSGVPGPNLINASTTTTFTGILKGNGSNVSTSTYSDVVGLFSGCSGSQYLGYDGSCHTAGGSGTVTNFIDSSGLFVVATSSTTPTTTFAPVSANQVLAGPNGSSGTPSFRSLVAADIPTINVSSVTGAVPTTTTVNGQALSGNITTTLASQSDVAVSSPASNQVLTYNGSAWSNQNPPTTGGNQTVMYYQNTASDVSGYDVINISPALGTQADLSAAVTSGTQPVLIKAFAYPSAGLGITSIPAGEWDFDSYAYVNAGTTTSIRADVYKRTSGGTETLLFTSQSQTISGAAASILSWQTIQGSFSVNTTDRLVIKINAMNTAPGSNTVHFVFDGTTNVGHIHTPLSGIFSSLNVSGNVGIGGALTLGTPLAIAQGGTGQITQQAAIDALAGATTSTQYLRGNGTHVQMSAIQVGDVPTLNQNTTGSAASFTGSLSGDVTGTQSSTAIAATVITGKALTGYSSTTGAILSTDSVLTGIEKLNGNQATYLPLAGGTMTGRMIAAGISEALSTVTMASSTTAALNFSGVDNFLVNASGFNVTGFTVSNYPSLTSSQTLKFTLDVSQTSSAGTVTYSASGYTIVWANAVTPTTTASKHSISECLVYGSASTTWLCTFVGTY